MASRGLFLERSFISWIFQTCEDIWKNINDEFLLSQDCSHKMCNFCLCVHTQMVLGNLVQNCPVWSNKVILYSQIYKKGQYEQRWGAGKTKLNWLTRRGKGSCQYFGNMPGSILKVGGSRLSAFTGFFTFQQKRFNNNVQRLVLIANN